MLQARSLAFCFLAIISGHALATEPDELRSTLQDQQNVCARFDVWVS